MKIAIPLFGTRIAPRFDCFCGFLVVTARNGEVISQEELPAGPWTRLEKIRKLTELGVDTLVCGGIDRASERHLSHSGVMIYSWITGEAEDALICLLRGELESNIMMGPGGHRRGRWRFKAKIDPCVDGQTRQRGRRRGDSGGHGMGRGGGYGKS